MYTITKIKTFNGREGQGLNATICANGKPICFVMDDASGGEVRYDYRNSKQNRESFLATTLAMAAQAEKEIGEYCLSLLTDAERARSQKECAEMKASYAPQLNIEMKMRGDAVENWVNNTIDALQTKKRFDRISKTKTLFRLKGDKVDEWRTIGVPYSDPRAPALMQKTYGESVVQIWGVAG